jgi:hypothetical protein
MWYVAGSNQENYLVHGHAESESGSSDWSQHIVFAEPELKMFDFCVLQRGAAFDAIFARVWFGADTPPPETGLWWCRADKPGGHLSAWSQPIQIMTADDCGWHSLDHGSLRFNSTRTAASAHCYSLTVCIGRAILGHFPSHLRSDASTCIYQ